MLAAQEKMTTEFEQLNNLDAQVNELAAEHKRLLAAYRQCARELTASRKALAQRFEQAMMEQLRDLGMEKTVFEVAFAPHTGRQPCRRATATTRWNS